MKKIVFLILSGICLSTLSQAQISTFPYTESFDSGSFPTAWSQEYISGSANWVVSYGGFSGSPSAPYSGSGNALFSSPNYDGNETFMVSPAFDFSAVSNPRLKFWHAQYNWDTDQDKLWVYYKTSASGEWILLASYTTAVTAWTQRTIELPNTGSEYYIGFKAQSGYGFGVVIDQIVVDNAPTCNTPTGFQVLSTSTESVNLGWTSNGNLWQIEYGLSGFTQGSGTLIDNITTNPYTIFGLSEGTSYQAYVKTVCSGASSGWAGPVNFTADCNPISSNNFIESFESTTAPPACWSVVYQNASPPAGNLVTHSSSFAFSGNKSFRFSSYSPGPPYGQYLVSPQIAAYTGTREFRFWYRRYNSGSEIFRVGYSTSGNNLTTDFNWSSEISNASAEWKLYTQTLPANVKYVAINYRTVFQYYLYIDQLQIRIPPTCPQPENLYVSNITAVSAHLNWIAGGTESSWQIEYGPAGFQHGEGTLITSSFAVNILNNLTPNTQYDVYVRAVCGAENSLWTGPVTFSTPYGCSPITSMTVQSVTSGTAFINWNPSGSETSWNLEYGQQGFIPGTGTLVQNITDSEYEISGLIANSSYEFRIQADCGSPFGLAPWSILKSFVTLPCDNGCDYQVTLEDAWGDGWGDSYISVLQNGSETGQLKLNNGQTLTQALYLCDGESISLVLHPSAFVSEIGLTLNDPFGNEVYHLEPYSLEEGTGITQLLSFTATCTEPECLPPFNMSLSGLSSQSVDLSWNHSVPGSIFQISYGLAGITPETGTFIDAISAENYSLGGLVSQQTYEVYLRTDCGSQFSVWTGPYSFTTTAMDLNNPVSCNAAINIPDNHCVNLSININESENTVLGMDVLLEEIRFIIEHPFDGDIDMSLTSPDGTTVLLLSDVGGSGDNFGVNNGSCNQYTSLRMDGANGSIVSGTAPFTGSFIPEGNFADFHNGGSINGNWTLQICDDNPAFNGSLQYFEMLFYEQKYMQWSSLSLIESPQNNGSVNNTIALSLFNDNFMSTGLLTEGIDFTATNVPEGLSAQIEVTGNTTAILSFTGNATAHANIDDVNNIGIEFLDAAFQGNDAHLVVNFSQSGISIDFKNLTDISNISASNTEYVCENQLHNYFVDYMLVNTGENTIPAGSNIILAVEDAMGNTLLEEDIILSNNLDPGSDLSGTSTGSVYFDQWGENCVFIILRAPSDIVAMNDTIEKCIFGIAQHMVFWNEENDSLAVSEYPAIVAAWLEFEPDVSLPYTYYWQHGISTSNSIDVVHDGWYRCTITTEACPVTDSVYVYLVNSASELKNDAGYIIYPNPTSGFVNIDGCSTGEFHYFELINTLGETIETKSFDCDIVPDQVQFNLSGLPAGMYVVRMFSSKNISNHRIIKK